MYRYLTQKYSIYIYIFSLLKITHQLFHGWACINEHCSPFLNEVQKCDKHGKNEFQIKKQVG